MPRGLEVTLELLAQSPNEAAADVLLPALDSFQPEIQEGALAALLDRHSLAGQREILRRLHTINARWREIVDARRGRMSRAVRDAILGRDDQLFRNGCQAAVWFREYDQAAALITVLEDPQSPHRDAAATTLLELVDLLYSELAAPRDYAQRRDPQLMRRHCTTALEQSLSRFSRHRRPEVIEAFLTLSTRENASLQRMLLDPREPAYVTLLQTLRNSDKGGVLRLLLSFLDDPTAPSAALSVIGHRSDAKFVQHLLQRVGAAPSTTVANNLRRMETVEWVKQPALLLEFDGELQQSAVTLAMASGMKRLEVFSLLDYLVWHGGTPARQAATAALAGFNGAEASAVVQRALGDHEPVVRAAAIGQLRRRGLPGAMSRLVAGLDSPHECERAAARSGLAEFTFARYIAAFDQLDEAVRETTGQLVGKVDLETVPRLKIELESQSRTRRLRAVAASMAIGCVEEVVEELITLLGEDEDHFVRQEIARALALAPTPAAVEALREALRDRNVPVGQAAAETLAVIEERACPVPHSATPLTFDALPTDDALAWPEGGLDV